MIYKKRMKGAEYSNNINKNNKEIKAEPDVVR